jgi:hypothetical protein
VGVAGQHVRSVAIGHRVIVGTAGAAAAHRDPRVAP